MVVTLPSSPGLLVTLDCGDCSVAPQSESRRFFWSLATKLRRLHCHPSSYLVLSLGYAPMGACVSRM